MKYESKCPQHLNPQRNCGVYSGACVLALLSSCCEEKPFVFSFFFFPAFTVRDLFPLDCQLAMIFWSFQITSSTVPLQKPPRGQRDFCVHVRVWACVCLREMEYVGDLNAYLYFSFKLVGIRHIIQHIAFKISAVACWMLCCRSY